MYTNDEPHARKATPTLIVTFLLGIGIGFTLCFAFFVPPDTDRTPAPTVEKLKAATPTQPRETRVEAAERQREPAGGGAAAPSADKPPGEAPKIADVAAVEPLPPARHLFVAVKGERLDDDTRRMLGRFKPWGVLLQSEKLGDRTRTRELVRRIKEAVGLGTGLADFPLIAVAQEGGPANPLSLDQAPAAEDLGKRNDLAATRDVARLYAAVARERGIVILFAPMLDVFRPGVSDPALRPRMFASDPETVSGMGLAFSEGLIGGGLLPVAKHYPGLGAAVRGDDGQLTIPDTEMRSLGEAMLPFLEAAENEIPGILVGHMAVPVLDNRQPPRPAALSPVLVRAVLRDQWKYDGIIFADDITTNPMTAWRSSGEVVVEALAAGCDAVLLYEADYERVEEICNAITAALESGALSRERLEESQARLEAWQARLRAPTPQPPHTRVVRHTIRRGDTLVGIASKYHVYVSDIKAWNGLTDSTIRFGQKLSIYVSEEKPPVPALAVAEPEASEDEPLAADDETGEEPAVPAMRAALSKLALPPALPTPEPGSASAPAPNTQTMGERAPGPPSSETHESAAQSPAAGTALDESPSRTERESGEREELEAPMQSPPEKPPAPLERAPQPPNTTKREHIVAAEETLEAIAVEYSVPPGDLAAWNALEDTPPPGTLLTIYVPIPPVQDTKESSNEAVAFETYTVRRGDTLRRIAGKFRTTSAKIIDLNKLEDPDRLLVGQKLKVPKNPD